MVDVDIRNLPVGTAVRVTENIAAGRIGGVHQIIPAGDIATVIGVYDPYTDDTAYRVQGTTNTRETGTGIAFHDELEVC